MTQSHAHAPASAIAASIDYLVAHYKDRPDLDTLARRAGYETTHFQKLFRAHVGISPKRLGQFMSMRHVRGLLESGQPTLDAALDAGLSGGGRLHDLTLSCAGVTPGDIQKRGQGLRIIYGFYPTRLGEVMIAHTPRGICWIGFQVDESRARSLERMHRGWPHAKFTHDDAAITEDGAAIDALWGGLDDGVKGLRALRLDLYGTNFQIQVWQALLRIAPGQTRTYSDIAAELGRPCAGRAVGNAVGANPVSLLIPCHRVIRATGIIDNYGWGSARKKLILGVEATI